MQTANVGNVGDPVEIVTGTFEELTAAVQKMDPRALSSLRMGMPQRRALIQAAAQNRPDLQPLVNHVLLPMMAKGSRLADSVARQAAIAKRVSDTADYLEAATHIVPINFDATADAGTNTADVTAPHSGQPWRYLTMFAACSAAVGVRLTSFEIASTNHITTGNVTYGTAPTAPGIDFAMFTGANHLAATRPQYQYRPWGIGRAGVLRPDAHIKIAIVNKSGAAASTFVGLMVQSSPCGEGSAYPNDRGGAYRPKSKATRAFLNKIVKFSMFG